MIPKDELGHYQDAELHHADHTFETEADPEVVAEAKRQQHLRMMQLREGCRRIIEASPAVWGELKARVTPRADTEGVLHPHGTLTFGELAAFKMGQQAVVDWITIMSQWTEEQHDG